MKVITRFRGEDEPDHVDKLQAASSAHDLWRALLGIRSSYGEFDALDIWALGEEMHRPDEGMTVDRCGFRRDGESLVEIAVNAHGAVQVALRNILGGLHADSVAIGKEIDLEGMSMAPFKEVVDSPLILEGVEAQIDEAARKIYRQIRGTPLASDF